jgi:hydroxymethylglutaryl-CoA synthase
MNNNIGIIDIETYFPKLFVSQEKLEKTMGLSNGNITKGLMQNNMAVVDCSEDIVSMSLTALNNLIEVSGIELRDIGRLSIGTETPIDKSKSIKTFLMDKFQQVNNYDILGVDYVNACYGGTAAFLDSVNWIESSRWDGRYAVVITGDIAIYEEGPARPTGGAGVTAMIIGPNSPIVLDKTISSYFENAYDFYKPNLDSEFPVVDGKFSNECYLKALDHCYHQFCIKDGRDIMNFDYSIFHAPYGKLVKKSYERLLDKEDEVPNQEKKNDLFNKRVEPCLKLSSECGNMYTASVYGSLYSLLVGKENVANKNAMIFSYGSGLASSMFSLKFSPDANNFDKWKNRDLEKRFQERVEITPEEFNLKLKRREEKYILNNNNLNKHKPIVFQNTYTLNKYDNLSRRSYKISNIQKRRFTTNVLKLFRKII